jgi:PhnB protein
MPTVLSCIYSLTPLQSNAMAAGHVPKNYHSVTPMLAIRQASDAIAWYIKVFDAEEVIRLTDPKGTIAHVELRLGDSLIMLAEEHPEYNRSPSSLQGTSVIIHLYVENVDEVVIRAVKAGAKLIFPVKDQFYGDRSGRFEDPFGHMWIVSTSTRKLPPEEMQRIFKEMMLRNSGM